MQRRELLQAAGLAGGLLAGAAAQAAPLPHPRRAADSAPQQLLLTIFSRHLQWVSTQAQAMSDPYGTGVLIGQAAQAIGFGAVDLTVRNTGHVDPNLVDFRVNLPQMLAGLRSTGAACSHITTNIVDDVTPIATYQGTPVLAEDLLRVAADEGITLYRWGGFSYNVAPDSASGLPQPFGDAVLEQLDAFAARVRRLALLNRRYRLLAAYHTFSGGNNGRSVWDLMRVMRQFKPGALSLNFDIGHMVTESALSAWRTNLRYAMPAIGGIGLKDSLVERNPSNGSVRSVWKQAGTGMVQWREFFQLLLQGGYSGPAEAQYEYDVTGLAGTTVSLNTTFWADHPQFASGNLNAAFMTQELQKDLLHYRAQAEAGGWTPNQIL